MNREIKFRGKYIHGENWIEGDLMHSNGCVYIFPDPAPNIGSKYQVDPDSVQQLTTFLDRNGNQIWEWDRVRDYVMENDFIMVFTDYGNFGLKSDIRVLKDYE